MSQAYTPGLNVSARTVIRRRRILPVRGDVLVHRGDAVEAGQVVARTELPGEVYPVNVAHLLGVGPRETPEAMRKAIGEWVEEGEELARTRSFFGLFQSTVPSPRAGTIEAVSNITGQVLLRGRPQPVEVDAYIPGVVLEEIPGEGVVVECRAAFIQGIFGIGPERVGRLKVLASGPDEPLEADRIREEDRGCILVGGSLVTAEALRAAGQVGVLGVVVGGLDDRDLREYLGYDLGVAITGNEEIPLTLILTEGFGRIRMAGKTFALFKAHDGAKVSINGATQIRAGVIRPEIVIPLSGSGSGSEEVAAEEGLSEGSLVRCIREPHFGLIGRVVALPAQPRKLESETWVRVAEVEFEGSERAWVPRANLERIEGQ